MALCYLVVWEGQRKAIPFRFYHPMRRYPHLLHHSHKLVCCVCVAAVETGLRSFPQFTNVQLVLVPNFLLHPFFFV